MLETGRDWGEVDAEWHLGSGFDWIPRAEGVTGELVDLAEEWGVVESWIEWPKTRGGATGVAASNSGAVDKLVGTAMMIRQALLEYGAVGCVTVHKWKGSVPKHVTAQRVLDHWGLDVADDNEADAIGIGDWYFRKYRKLKIVT